MYKAGLVIEGGAMRGVYVSGVLDTLIEENIEIENVYGISAGAKNSQYYISKEKEIAFNVDCFCAHSLKSISFYNLLFKGGMINGQYYKEKIMNGIGKINREAFLNSKQNYYVGATNCLNGELELFDAKKEDYLDKIIASCSMPYIQKKIYINDIPYLDGGISNPIPYDKALEKNQKVVIILTRPKGYRAAATNKKLIKLAKKKYYNNKEMLYELINSNELYNKRLEEIERLESEHKIFVIRPSKYIHVKRLERNHHQLELLYQLGKDDMSCLKEDLLAYLKA